MKTVFVSLIVALISIIATATPAMAVEESVAAEATISEMINFTIEDRGDAGLKFGSLNPGSSDNPEIAQNGSGAVTLWLGADSNVDCYVSTKANDFSNGSDTIHISNVRWNTDNDASGAAAMTKDYSQITVLSPGESQNVWHWLSVPTNQAPGSYATDFYYQALDATP